MRVLHEERTQHVDFLVNFRPRHLRPPARSGRIGREERVTVEPKGWGSSGHERLLP
ncbi:uncharacterized protein LACBIDRAFT_299657 [Laccaria bicolor S238N-H82]|uniref:Predicted protein n=1 Tax=Laccaria bicolor (strain S238N-H82 / ATCC MYA-4686) TaxID=486041 RepID=B0DF39_LACBS|nr:uncharacterized protein LACBIDRAFT_299657 [Laccaria bicolor S238N-H82]EDR06783.1 predicted protein [Laccaria bicolor S238N-H82]|eukprot:XP_001882630.1 predicted protein [Laccaria bicolor S238N-H82]